MSAPIDPKLIRRRRRRVKKEPIPKKPCGIKFRTKITFEHDDEIMCNVGLIYLDADGDTPSLVAYGDDGDSLVEGLVPFPCEAMKDWMLTQKGGCGVIMGNSDTVLHLFGDQDRDTSGPICGTTMRNDYIDAMDKDNCLLAGREYKVCLKCRKLAEGRPEKPKKPKREQGPTQATIDRWEKRKAEAKAYNAAQQARLAEIERMVTEQSRKHLVALARLFPFSRNKILGALGGETPPYASECSKQEIVEWIAIYANPVDVLDKIWNALREKEEFSKSIIRAQIEATTIPSIPNTRMFDKK